MYALSGCRRLPSPTNGPRTSKMTTIPLNMVTGKVDGAECSRTSVPGRSEIPFTPGYISHVLVVSVSFLNQQTSTST